MAVKNPFVAPMIEYDSGLYALMPLPAPPPPPLSVLPPPPPAVRRGWSRFRRVALGVALAYAVMLVMLFAVVLLYASTHDSYRECGDVPPEQC